MRHSNCRLHCTHGENSSFDRHDEKSSPPPLNEKTKSTRWEREKSRARHGWWLIRCWFLADKRQRMSFLLLHCAHNEQTIETGTEKKVWERNNKSKWANNTKDEKAEIIETKQNRNTRANHAKKERKGAKRKKMQWWFFAHRYRIDESARARVCFFALRSFALKGIKHDIKTKGTSNYALENFR